MKAIIHGASGLVGNELLTLLLANNRYSEVISFVRKPLNIQNPKLRQIVTELDQLAKYSDEFIRTDALFCCLGTTIKKAKSKENFKKVDYQYPLEAAKILKNQDGKHFIVITALDSNSESKIFYNKVKGELENALRDLNLKRLSIIRPSLLLGERNEKRFFEGLGQKLVPYISFLIPEKYKPVTGKAVAEVMLQTSLGECLTREVEVETI